MAAGWEPAAVGLACAIAARLIGRELATNPPPPPGSWRRKPSPPPPARHAAGGDDAPGRLAALGERFVRAGPLAALGRRGGRLTRRPDALGPADCVVRTAEHGIGRRPARPPGWTGSPPSCCRRGTTPAGAAVE